MFLVLLSLKMAMFLQKNLMVSETRMDKEEKWESEKARMGWLVNMGIPRSISLLECPSYPPDYLLLGFRILLWASRAQAVALEWPVPVWRLLSGH